jgi:HD domain
VIESTPFPKALWWYSSALFVAASATGVALGFAEGLPDLGALAVLGALLVFASHRDVALRAGLTVNPGFMISIAAVVVFAREGSLLGALSVGMLHGIYLPSFTKRCWGWVPFNGGVTGIAWLLAALVFFYSPHNGDLPWGLLAVVTAAVVATAVSWVLLVGSYRVERQPAPSGVISDLGHSFLEVLPFAFLGYLLGELYLELGPAVMVLVIVPIVIAREMFASYIRVKESHEETVQMLVRALEAKDRYTAGHAERVADYARYIGQELNFMPARLERLRFAALMHDIGKLVVPNHLLNKPGRLTPEEFAQVRIHEKVSVQMLSHIDFLRPIAGAGHSDNTRFDPDDPDHPIEPYIVMIADAYDAMTSTRAYRKALTQDVAFQELRDKTGLQFHPACVEALIAALRVRDEKHGAGYERSEEFRDAPDIGLGSAGLGDLLPSEKG